MAELFPPTYSRGRSTPYSSSSHDLYVTIPRFFEGVYVNSFFPQSLRLFYLDFLPAERFPLTYDLNGFTSRVTSTQPIKCVPGTPGNLVIKSKLSFCSDSIVLRQLNRIYKKVP